MKLTDKHKSRIFAFLALLCWGTNVIVNWLEVQQNEIGTSFSPGFLYKLTFVLEALFIYQFFKFRVTKAEISNIVDLLWKVFVTGLITTILSMAGRFFFLDTRLSFFSTGNIYWVSVVYSAHIGLLLVYLSSTFHVWKKLILFQKTKVLVRAWSAYEYGLSISLLLTFTSLKALTPVYNLIFVIFIITGIVLGFNLKWVAYLNFKQKWRSILLILLASIYFYYFFISTIAFSNEYSLLFDVTDVVAIPSVYFFNLSYGLFAILVILFNLPTSSVFEQKFEEFINFQRLSQPRNTGLDQEQIYQILLDSTTSAVMASAGWLDIYSEEGTKSKTYYQDINKPRVNKIREIAEKSSHGKSGSRLGFKSQDSSHHIIPLTETQFKSALVSPVIVQEKRHGMLYLLKDVSEGFNKEMTDIIGTFINQAAISLENYNLLKDAIQNERYKEELKIAKRVQNSLLPEKLDRNDDFEICAYSKSAAEVGGDYYDTFPNNGHKTSLIIGDVSGKGTSAAFHMSQMKGIFQSLSQLDLDSDDFMVRSNRAISKCLDRTSLITASVFFIDKEKSEIEYCRAGHCPSLYYFAKDKEAKYFYEKSLGLGILRDDRFRNFVSKHTIPYQKGDILCLFTDGITEAKNDEGEEYGYDQLKEIIEKHKDETVSSIQDAIIDSVHSFCGKKSFDDDFTIMLVKFI